MSKPRPPFHLHRRSMTGSRVRYALTVGLATLTLTMITLTAGPGYAQDQLQVPTRLSATTGVQVTPTPHLSPSPTPNQPATFPRFQVPDLKSLTVAGGLLFLTGIFALFLLVLVRIVLLFLPKGDLRVRARYRRRQISTPPPTMSVPFLKSSDGHLYFRLDNLSGDGLVIGRGRRGVDLQIDESIPYADTVSKWHARIYYDSTCGYVIIEDLDSMNGVFINGRRAPRKNLLKDGWIIGLGKVTLTYRDGKSDTGPLG